MILSKSRTLRFLRCPRSIAYEEIEKNKLDSTSVFHKDYTLEDFYTEEHQEELRSILNSIYGDEADDEFEDAENLLDKEQDTRNLEIYQQDYIDVEKYAALKVENLYGGTVISSPNNNKLQKLFTYKKDDFEFTSLTDIYQEDDEYIRIVEVKASTDSYIKKDLKVSYLTDKKNQLFFMYDEKNDLYFPNFENIKFDSIKKIFDKYDTKFGKFVYDLAFQYYTFKNSVKTNKKIVFLLAVLNSDYYYDGKRENGQPIYDVNKLFTLVDMTKILDYFSDEFNQEIEKLIGYINESSIDAPAPFEANKEKAKPGIKCRYANLCLKEYNIPKQNSILAYDSNHHGFKYEGEKVNVKDLIFEHHIVDMLDLKPGENLERKKNILQYNCVKNNKRYMEKAIINEIFKKALVYPLFHLDFESIQFPLPKFKNQKPYTQSLFQYSVHIQKQKYQCDEKEDNYYYLNKDCTNDYREEFLINLLQVLEKDEKGSIIVYNQAFEETRLKEMALAFPLYKERIEKVIDRLFDLYKLLKGAKKFVSKYTNKVAEYDFLFYDPKQNGSFSIKKVLPLFTDRSYSNIAVHNGIDAVYVFSKLKSENEDGYFEKRSNLIQYCGLDTYSMVIILDGLLKEVEGY